MLCVAHVSCDMTYLRNPHTSTRLRLPTTRHDFPRDTHAGAPTLLAATTTDDGARPIRRVPYDTAAPLGRDGTKRCNAAAATARAWQVLPGCPRGGRGRDGAARQHSSPRRRCRRHTMESIVMFRCTLALLVAVGVAFFCWRCSVCGCCLKKQIVNSHTTRVEMTMP